MTCPKCGAKIADNAVMCPHCNRFLDSKPENVDQSSTRNNSAGVTAKGKPKKKKRTVLWTVLGVLVVLIIIGAMNGDKDSSTSKSTAKNPVSTDQKESISEPAIAEVDSASTAPVDQPDQNEANEYTMDLDTVIAILRITLSQNFGEDYYTMEYDDTGVTINVWGDGIALGAVTAISDEDAKESWDFMVESQTGFCDIICEQIESAGIENYYVMLNVLNEMDKDRTLLSILNGAVIYDAVNG